MSALVDAVGIGPGPLVAVTALLILARGVLGLPTQPPLDEPENHHDL